MGVAHFRIPDQGLPKLAMRHTLAGDIGRNL